VRRTFYNWREIQQHYSAGNDRDACIARFGFRITTWYKARAEGRISAVLERRLVNWGAVQQYYDEGNTYGECRAKFKFSSSSWSSAVRRGAIVTRSHRFPLKRLLAESTSRCSIKRRLLEAGVLVNRCAGCGISEWNQRPVSMQLHHENGVRDDHRVENLRMLCPNCHSQTSTFGAKNKKK
jgi:hypothetical protein